jgi:hypothetical protein
MMLTQPTKGTDPAVWPDAVGNLQYSYSTNLVTWDDLEDADSYTVNIYNTSDQLLSTIIVSCSQYNLEALTQDIDLEVIGRKEAEEGDPRKKRILADPTP